MTQETGKTDEPHEHEPPRRQCELETPPADTAPPPRWRPASEPTCCGSGCTDCPF